MDNYLFVFIVIAIVTAVLINLFIGKKKTRQRLLSEFGRATARSSFVSDSIFAFHHIVKEQNPGEPFIDDVTWNDLDMDEIFLRINSCLSSVGEEYLYHLLHTQRFEEDKLIAREMLIKELETNQKLRLKLQTTFKKLGINYYNGVSEYMVSGRLKALENTVIYNIPAMIPIVGLILSIHSLSIGLPIIITSFIINLIIHYRIKGKLEKQIAAIGYFSDILLCAGRIVQIKHETLNQHIQPIKENLRKFNKLKNKVAILTSKSGTEFDFIFEYLKIMFLTDVRRYNRVASVVTANIAEVKSLFENIGEIEACIAIASFRQSIDFYCTPEFAKVDSITMKNLYHPLLTEPVTNDATLDKNTIVTGSNASGKSTFIKAVAINTILSQTIYTCTADRFCYAIAYTVSSMAISDDITTGDSYFVSEIKSLKRISQWPKHIHCVCFIDEILKGTNTVERIAASASMLSFLKTLDCVCLIATHDIELTEILKNDYDNYHFRETVTQQGVEFDYLIKPGPSTTKNAIKLLEHLQLDKEIVDGANELVTRFESTKSWAQK